MPRLLFILAESALELVPKEMVRHRSVSALAKRRGKRPDQLLLDRSYHHDAMKRLPQAFRRGRPDIVHLTLLSILGSPLEREGLMDVFVHTLDDNVIRVNPSARLPKNYERFVGLIEQLYEDKVVPAEGERLLELRQQTLTGLLEELRVDHVVAFGVNGRSHVLRELFADLPRRERIGAIVGGFPKGHLKPENEKLASELVRIDKDSLEAWQVASRIVYEFECAIELAKHRLA